MQATQSNALLGGAIFEEYRDLLSGPNTAVANVAMLFEADSGNPQCPGGGGGIMADSGNPQCPGGDSQCCGSPASSARTQALSWIDLPRA